MVAQKASSIDLEKIDHKIIESVKFRFLKREIIGKKFIKSLKKNSPELKNLKDFQNANSLFETEEQLLKEVLKNETVKHYRQLTYLAKKHDNALSKIRFVLNPFSFVFLLSGQEQYHIVLETFDTEEATYIWHINKDLNSIRQVLNSIDQELNIIRNKGRMFYLQNPPTHFSKIIHDYSEERKGFIVWKDQLEERLV